MERPLLPIEGGRGRRTQDKAPEGGRVTMKRKLRLGILLLGALSVALIPLNLFVLPFPEWVTVLTTLGALALNVLLWRGGGKRALALSAFSLLTCAAALFGSYCNPYWSSATFRGGMTATVRDDALTLTGAEAARELDAAMGHLKKLHPAFLGGAPEETMARYDQARRTLAGMDAVDLCALSREIEAVLATLHDGHTLAAARYNEPHRLADAAGKRIVAVNGASIDELLARNGSYFSYETEGYGRLWIESRLLTAEGLAYLGIDPEGVAYTYARPDGTDETVVYRRSDFTVESGAAEETPFVSYEFDPAHDLAVLRLDRCVYNDEYRSCLREFFAEVKRQGVRNIAVDLRHNGGGNSQAADEFIRYLNAPSYRGFGSEWRLGPFLLVNEAREVKNRRYADLTFRGNLYVLTAAYTFSSGTDFAMLLGDNGLATLIGEPPGNLPDSYGDAALFTLPRSGIAMQVSTKRFHRVDGEQAGRPVEPDVLCEATEAMEALYQTTSERS